MPDYRMRRRSRAGIHSSGGGGGGGKQAKERDRDWIVWVVHRRTSTAATYHLGFDCFHLSIDTDF